MGVAAKQLEVADTPEAEIRRLVDLQKKTHIEEGPMSAERRMDLITRCIKLLIENKDAIVDSLSLDFGSRSPQGSMATDVGSTLGALKYARKNVRKWMKASKRHSMAPLGFLDGAPSLIRRQKSRHLQHQSIFAYYRVIFRERQKCLHHLFQIHFHFQ